MPSAAYVALSLVPGVGRVRLEHLLRAFGSAEEVLSAPLQRIRRVQTVSRAAATAIHNTSADVGARVIESVQQLGGTVLQPEQEVFPIRLREIPEAPTLLFALGNLDLLRSPCVAIVGSRDHSRYGAEVTSLFAGGLARAGLTVVSGMARGLDALAHQAALDAGGKGGGSVGVLGNGLGVVYPAANRGLYERMAREGCLVTEYPPGERPNAGSFPRRNRIISGLSRVTLIAEAGAGSGALITADCALTQGREVMAIPGPITSQVSTGTNRLLQLGAKPALELRDVLEEYGVVATVPQVSLPADLSEVERRTLDALSEGAEQIDDVTAQLRCAPADALAALTSLEIRGLVVQDPGKIFHRSHRASAAY